MDTRVNYGGSMDTLHEAKKKKKKNGIDFLKTTHTEKHVHSFFYSIVFRGQHSWRNRNRRMKEDGRRFSIPLYWLLPLFVYADIEAFQNEEDVFIPNLLCF